MSRFPSAALWAGCALAWTALSAGCAPSCATLCTKLDNCGFNRDVTRAECEVSCERELTRYVDEEDTEGRALFDDERTCLGGATCDGIAAGECYEPGLFPFTASP